MSFPPYIRQLVEDIKRLTQQPGEWETIRRALSNFKSLARLDKDGWRFYAIRRTKDGGEVKSVLMWAFSKWDDEDEVKAIESNKVEKDD